MEKAVLISIRPEWCQKIISGEKTIEVRKTRPKLEAPFKCYIYCTKGAKNRVAESQMKIIGEFTCDSITDWPDDSPPPIPLKNCCMTYSEIRRYGGTTETLYLWHISDLKIYDKPKPLSDFYRECKGTDDPGLCYECDKGVGEERDCGVNWEIHLSRPPQSWCYVE